MSLYWKNTASPKKANSVIHIRESSLQMTWRFFFSTRLYLPLYLTAPAQGYPGISDVITMDPSKALSPFKPELPNHKGSFFPCTCLLVKCLLNPHLCFHQAWVTYAILSHRMTKGMNRTMNLFTLFSLRNVQEYLSRLKFYRKCVSGWGWRGIILRLSDSCIPKTSLILYWITSKSFFSIIYFSFIRS